MTISVVVADDQELIRSGLLAVLAAAENIEVVGEAANGVEAVELCRRLKPTVCLMDIRMPKMDGIEATQILAETNADELTAVVILTTFNQDELVLASLKAGARGFLLKNCGRELLVQAIRSAAKGDALIAPQVTARLLNAFATTPVSEPVQPVEPLTPREEEVLLAVASGGSNTDIAEQLHIGQSTVKTHLGSLTRKLAARNRVDLAIWAYETGRIQPQT